MRSPPLYLTIDSLAYGPAGVGRVDGKVVFVPGTVPGDEVEVVLDEEKKTYAVGHVVTLRQPSSQRRLPPCPYVPRCGGCPWQQVGYAEQLRAKERLVWEQMRRIGGVNDPPVFPIIPCPQEWHYRHRIRLHVEPPARLGFYQTSSHELVEIDSCLIAGGNVAAQLCAARTWVASLQTPVRRVELLTGEPIPGQNQPGLVLIGDAEGTLHACDAATCQRFLDSSPDVAGLVLVGRSWRRVWGNPQISFDLGIDDLRLCVRNGTFTQVNPAGNRALIAALLELGDFDPAERVVELYCGAGNLSLPVARRVHKLIGIEQDRDAIADARANAARARVTNARFVCASVPVGIERLLRRGARSEVVILDPPRAGAAGVIDALPLLGAHRVVYVSCDPTTLARDLRRLHAYGYRVCALQPLDLFPQTYHVETIAVAVLTC